MESLFIKGIKSKKEHQDFKHVPAIHHFSSFSLTTPITFFVGENGTGKSTLLEAIAINYGFNPEGGSLHFNFITHNSHSPLSNDITLVKSGKHPKDGFFLRAESFYNVASYIEEIASDGMDLTEYGSRSLHQQSHGESFFNVISNRFRGNGVYILDEPEAALSPQRQLALLVVLEELVQQGSQFIIVSHSPILLAMKYSTIYTFDHKMITTIPYEETEPYKITKMFIENKESLLNKLFTK